MTESNYGLWKNMQVDGSGDLVDYVLTICNLRPPRVAPFRRPDLASTISFQATNQASYPVLGRTSGIFAYHRCSKNVPQARSGKGSSPKGPTRLVSYHRPNGIEGTPWSGRHLARTRPFWTNTKDLVWVRQPPPPDTLNSRPRQAFLSKETKPPRASDVKIVVC